MPPPKNLRRKTIPPDSDGLTLRQRRFVQALPLANSQTEAAIKAGYSPGGNASVEASLALRKPKVQAAIAAQRARLERASIASIVERKEKLTEILRKPLPERVPAQLVVASADLLNRMDNLYVERQETANLTRVEIVLVRREEKTPALSKADPRSLPAGEKGEPR